nr:MAG TPA: hypothetical protein [Caudoviricetes sp.]
MNFAFCATSAVCTKGGLIFWTVLRLLISSNASSLLDI